MFVRFLSKWGGHKPGDVARVEQTLARRLVGMGKATFELSETKRTTPEIKPVKKVEPKKEEKPKKVEPKKVEPKDEEEKSKPKRKPQRTYKKPEKAVTID